MKPISSKILLSSMGLFIGLAASDLLLLIFLGLFELINKLLPNLGLGAGLLTFDFYKTIHPYIVLGYILSVVLLIVGLCIKHIEKQIDSKKSVKHEIGTINNNNVTIINNSNATINDIHDNINPTIKS